MIAFDSTNNFQCSRFVARHNIISMTERALRAGGSRYNIFAQDEEFDFITQGDGGQLHLFTFQLFGTAAHYARVKKDRVGFRGRAKGWYDPITSGRTERNNWGDAQGLQ